VTHPMTADQYAPVVERRELLEKTAADLEREVEVRYVVAMAYLVLSHLNRERQRQKRRRL
jgi:hypothetical protein